MIQTKLVVLNIALANGSPAATLTKEIVLPKEYSRVTGIGVYEHDTKTGGAGIGKKLGFKQGAFVLADLSNQKVFLSTTNVKAEDRFLPVDLEANGQTVTVTYQNDAVLTADWSIDIVFRCENR